MGEFLIFLWLTSESEENEAWAKITPPLVEMSASEDVKNWTDLWLCMCEQTMHEHMKAYRPSSLFCPPAINI